MNAGLQVFVANIPTLIIAGIGGLLADRGHPAFAIVFLILAFTLAHSARGKDE